MFYLAAIIFVMVFPLGVPTVVTIIHAIGNRGKDTATLAGNLWLAGNLREAAVAD
ncbi:MAG TPA: hypothetical protein VMU34_13185 [Mycobacterium sp.]|nr:hypothetical protein [Mycobacterium sp.]